MRCQFEEKQYEQLLNNELAEKERIYIPGQVLENDIAIDAALFSMNPRFWGLWNNQRKMRWKSGLRLRPEFWDIAEATLNSDMFPRFKCNLFIQHKRPEFVSSPNGREYYHWHQPYLKYDIDDHQQGILLNLEYKTIPHALVVYACPSFWERKDLWKFMNGKLIENSNFVRPNSLRGHEKYTFIRGGNYGFACSKQPEKIEEIFLLGDIGRMIEKQGPFQNNVHFLASLANDVSKVTEELDESSKEGFRAISKNIEYPEHKLGRSIMTILAFNLFANTTWGIGYEIREPPTNHQRS